MVGSGPYGLATAAFLRAAGTETMVFGPVLEAWKHAMPGGMLLRSRARSSSIANPRRLHSLGAWAAARRFELPNPIPVELFVEYGSWFQQHAVGRVDARRVATLDMDGGRFHLALEDGTAREASHVVVAAGISPFARRPVPFTGLPRELVSHSSEHRTLDRLAGRRVAVVGGGQSALESAALLHEAGARVELIVRARTVSWLRDVTVAWRPTLSERMQPPTDVGGRLTGWIAAVPDAYRLLTPEIQAWVAGRCGPPAGAGWLVPRLAEVPITCGATVVAATADEGGARLVLSDGTERRADHVLLGTGFEVDVRSYPFLGRNLLGRLAIRDGYPVLGPGLESSVPKLHFTGAAATRSFGPLMRFVVGSWYAAPAVSRRILGRPRPPISFSF